MFTHRPCPRLLGALTLIAALAPSATAADAPTGEQIYKKKCLSCHGPTGEGSDKHDKPLVGDRSVAQLSKIIARTMPDDNPETLTAEEARSVAAYIFDAFYSPAARERLKPPRIEL